MSEDAPRKTWWLTAIPVAVFIIIAIVLGVGLMGEPSKIPSALIGKPAPDFTLPAIPGMDVKGFDGASLRGGQVTVVNVWASWCVPCRVEHPLLMELAKRRDIRLVGLNYKDEPENARRFLGTMGQPFAAIGADQTGRSAVDWGVYGVPETFIVDGKGLIRYKWIGPMTPEALTGAIDSEIRKAAQP